jgi:hypothetical protein
MISPRRVVEQFPISSRKSLDELTRKQEQLALFA